MNARFLRLAGFSFVLSAILLLAACHKSPFLHRRRHNQLPLNLSLR
jgi:hypothetical protein